MNAHALLSAQGWRGHGHSLHKADDSIGLAKPLLLNRKDNTKGLGATQHFTSDQWWMNAFDEQLQGLDTSKEGRVTQTITTGKLNAIEKGALGRYSLYTSFVRGGYLEGTLSSLENDSSDSDSDSDDTPTQTMADIAKNISRDEETKEEKRARKAAKKQRKEERAKKRAAKKKSKSSDTSDESWKEEKRLRRARKEERRKKRKAKEEKEKKRTKS